MKLFNLRNIIIFLSISLLCSVVFYGWYISQVNFYGDLKIFISDSTSKNPKNNYSIIGKGVLGKETEINYDTCYFKVDSHCCFKSIQVKPHEFDDSNQFKLVVLDKSDRILIDTVFYSSEFHEISDINIQDQGFVKIIFLTVKVSLLRITLLICILQVFMLVSIILFWKQDRKSFYIFLSSFIILTISLAQIFYFRQLRIWDSFFIIISFFLLIIGILTYWKKTKNNKNLILVFSSLFFAIIIAELVLRITGLVFTYFEERFNYYESIEMQNRIKPFWIRPAHTDYKLEAREFCFDRKSNSYGLSCEEPDTSVLNNSKVIIAIGDSFTEGDGTHKDSTWVKFLELQLIDDSIERLSFINAGICGSDPIYEYKLLKEKLLVLNPEMVIVAYGNELNDIIIRGGEERFETMRPAIKDKWWEPFFAVSHVFRLIVRAMYDDDYLLISSKDYLDRRNSAMQDLKKSIIDFKYLSQKASFKLIIVFYPMSHEMINGKFDYNDVLYNYAASHDINCVNLLNFYLQNGVNEENLYEYYWPKDKHHNAKGYQLFAEGVYPAVLKAIEQLNEKNYEIK